MLPISSINQSWTLFLDRDGVINQEKYKDYVYHFDEFKFYEGVLPAMQHLAKHFGTIVIVTNQKGIGKGLMTTTDLHNIHHQMLQAITAVGGRIDKIYFCPDLDDQSPNRKPQHGMALQAKQDFPQIDFKKSMMVGNKLSDMQFGRNAGMHTVFVATTNPEVSDPHPLIDTRFDSLAAFAQALT